MSQAGTSAGAGNMGRPRLHDARLRLRKALNWKRALPGFLIIGAQRSGTTSLHQYLAGHPDVAAPIRKEVHYFSTRYGAGPGWYRAHFPLASPGRHTFESTPYYLFHPLAPERAGGMLPEARLIAVLRNPIDRAYSHYLLNVAKGHESLTFEEAIQAEPDRLAAGRQSIDENNSAHQLFSYCARGRYADQVERWLSHFPAQQIHFALAEDLYTSPASVLVGVERFLGLSEWLPSEFENWSHRTAASSSQILPETRQMLAEHFEEPNRRIAALTGLSIDWN
ncbi:MAG: sulfotransferase [Acidimicrobiia bacterium]|nr:sulfotransferase [Acidimicrobiia bacterium]